ncbi:hypothetical protein MU1_57080 [Paenibacillus glycanilyticus]|uniref:Uncharacterized protein n=1 Tax=Paenibacillus glycanilyticus TaxID=126569 RepID=A0ABQ6GPF7_9BACL|nr:hypothetical protein MU1_57080 [Paenibacillus glycanilyticus]
MTSQAPIQSIRTSKSIHPGWFPRFQYKEFGSVFYVLGNYSVISAYLLPNPTNSNNSHGTF